MKTSAIHFPEVRNPTVVYLMGKRPKKKVSLFFDAAYAFSS